MNDKIKELLAQAHLDVMEDLGKIETNYVAEKFAELLIKKTLDEVAKRAYYSGDRAWSDELDRQWVELEFGLGPLSKVQNER